MDKVFDKEGFEELILTCPKCGWKGKGDEANIIDLYGLSKVQEVHCPNCDHYLGGLNVENEQEESDNDADEFQIG